MKYHALALALVFFISPITNAQNLESTPIAQLSTPLPDTPIKFHLDSDKLNDQQQQILNEAYKIAKDDNHKEPAILPALVYQETKAGIGVIKKKIKKITLYYRSRCFGVSQIKLDAAKEVLKEYPEVVDDPPKSDLEITNRLIEDDEFNMKVASKYLLIMEKFGNKSLQWKVAAYNQGPGTAKRIKVTQLPYVKQVVKLVKHFKQT